VREDSCGLEELDLLMLGKQEFRSLSPVRAVLPSMLDEAARVSVNFGTTLASVDRAPLLAAFLHGRGDEGVKRNRTAYYSRYG